MPFIKGKSGNPSGRPKVVQDFKALLNTPGALGAKGDPSPVERAFRVLLIALNGDDAVAAAKVLLAYGLGQPSQTVTMKREEMERLSDEELMAMANVQSK